MEKHNEKKLKNMLSDRAKYHRKFQKGMSPFCSLAGEPISIGGGMCESVSIPDTIDTKKYITQSIGKKNFIDREGNLIRIKGDHIDTLRDIIGDTTDTFEMSERDYDAHMDAINNHFLKRLGWIQVSKEFVPHIAIHRRPTPSQEATLIRVMDDYSRRPYDLNLYLYDTGNPVWKKYNLTETIPEEVMKRIHRYFNTGILSEDVSFEGKAMFCPSCGHRTLFFDNIHHVWSCSDCRKNYKYLVKNNHIEFIPEEYDVKLNKTKLKEEFVGKPEVGKTYWFKHSGGIRSGEFTRQTTSLNCFYVPEVDREVCIPIWANIATSREDIEGIEGVVDKMEKDTKVPTKMRAYNGRFFPVNEAVSATEPNLVVYNGTNIENFDYSTVDLSNSREIGLHCGTEDACRDRGYKFINKLTLQSPKVLSLSFDMTDVWSSIEFVRRLAQYDLFDEKQLESLENQMKKYADSPDKYIEYSTLLREFFLNKGYNVISYPNEGEDAGSTSYIVLDMSDVQYVNKMEESMNKFPGRAQLIGALKTFNKNGKISTRGNWRIANGGYDMSFEVYYNDTPVAQGMTDNVLKITYNTSEFGFSKQELADAICSVYDDIIYDDETEMNEGIWAYQTVIDRQPGEKQPSKTLLYGGNFVMSRSPYGKERFGADWKRHIKKIVDWSTENDPGLHRLTHDFRLTNFGKDCNSDEAYIAAIEDMISKGDYVLVEDTNYSDSILLTEAPDIFGFMTDDELDADEAERRARFEKELADRRRVNADSRAQWQQHKPTYDKAVRKFKRTAGATINKLVKDIESGRLLQWGYYESPQVVVRKEYKSDLIAFEPVKSSEQPTLTKWLDYVSYDVTNGKVGFSYYSNAMQRNLDAYAQLASFLDICASAVDAWVADTEKENAEATQKAVSRFFNYFVDTPSKIDCAFDCSNPGHYRHGGRYYIFSVGGKVYHYEDYDSGAYTNNHVHKLTAFNQIGIKNHNWKYDNPVITKIDPSNVGLQIRGDGYRSCYVEGGKVDINKLISLSESFNRSLNEKKKKKPYDSINYNAGNVEHNISMFNKMNNPITQPIVNPVNGNIGGEGCCEALEDRKKKLREGMRLTNGMKEDESLYFDDGDYSYHIFRRTPFGSNAETEWAVLVVDYGLRFHHDKMYKDEKTGIDTVPVDVVHDKPKKIAYFEFTDETLPEAADAFLDEDGKKFTEVIKAEAQKHIEITEDLDADAEPKDVITEVGKQELRDFLTSIICEREDDLALEFGEDDRLWDEFFEVNLESYTDKYREDIIKHFNLTTKED